MQACAIYAILITNFKENFEFVASNMEQQLLNYKHVKIPELNQEAHTNNRNRA